MMERSSRPTSAPSTGRCGRIPRPAPTTPSGAVKMCEAEEGEEKSGTNSLTLPISRNSKRRCVTLLQSTFLGRAPTLYFDYEGKEPPGRLVRDKNLPKMYYTHSSAVHRYNCVVNTLRRGGLFHCSHSSGKWCLLWGSHPKPESLRAYHPYQKTNHYPGSWHLGRKDLVSRHVARMRRAHGSAFNIHPQCFVLPDDARSFVEARQSNPKAIWIYKPSLGSCGRGIRLISGTTGGEKLLKRQGVIQRYLGSPLLINGYKFDLRLYVVLTSIDPLKIYVFNEGLVRFATEKYSLNPATLKKTTMHLTNYSLNKHSDNYVKNMDSSPASPTPKAGKRASRPVPVCFPAGDDNTTSTMTLEHISNATSDPNATATPKDAPAGTPLSAAYPLSSLRDSAEDPPWSPSSFASSPLARRPVPSGLDSLDTKNDSPNEKTMSLKCMGSLKPTTPLRRGLQKQDTSEFARNPPYSPSGPLSPMSPHDPMSDGLEEDGADGSDDEDVTFKWSLQELRDYFASQGWDYAELQTRIDDLLTKSILAVEPTLVTHWHRGTTFSTVAAAEAGQDNADVPKVPNQNCCELYGFDVLIDAQFKPWLLEVNVCPSLSSSSPLDKRIKTSLVADFLTLMGLRHFDHKVVEKEVAESRSQRLLGLQPRSSSKAGTASRKSLIPLTSKDGQNQVFGPMEQHLIADFVDEVNRRGNFERVYPKLESVQSYAPYFTTTRHSNTVLAQWLQCGGEAHLARGTGM